MRYRKINGADVQGVGNNSNPTGLYDLYVATEGGDGALFPVIDTKIGRLALITCYGINFPEMVRALAMRGAEVLLLCTGEPYAPHREPWEMGRRTRAFENAMYIVSANHGGYASQISGAVFADTPGLNFQQRRDGEIAPLHRSHGGSEVVDFNGGVIGRAHSPGEALAKGSIDIAALRRRRAEMRDNVVAQTRSEIYAREYAAHQGSPLNRWLDNPIQEKREGLRNTRDVIDRYLRDEVYVPPAVAAEDSTQARSDKVRAGAKRW